MATIGDLHEAIIGFTKCKEAWGRNLSENKDVLIRVGGETHLLGKVSASFIDGRFCLVLDTASADGAAPVDSPQFCERCQMLQIYAGSSKCRGGRDHHWTHLG